MRERSERQHFETRLVKMKCSGGQLHPISPPYIYRPFGGEVEEGNREFIICALDRNFAVFHADTVDFRLF